MADIKLNLKHLTNIRKIYIVSVDNECKELLFLLDRNFFLPPLINVVSLYNKQCTKELQIKGLQKDESCKLESSDNQHFAQRDNVTLSINDEEEATASYSSVIGRFLYEPWKGMLKAGAYKWMSQEYGCSKLAVSTHLYTSDKEIQEFPGKVFEVEEVVPFSKKGLKEVAKKYPKADVTARNFTMDTNALKKLSGIKDGGNRHIFAVTLHNGDRVLLIASQK